MLCHFGRPFTKQCTNTLKLWANKSLSWEIKRNNEAYARILKYFLGMVIYPSLVINLFTITYTNIPHYMVIFYEYSNVFYIEKPTINISLNCCNSYSTFAYIELSVDRTKGRNVKNSIALTRILTFTRI